MEVLFPKREYGQGAMSGNRNLSTYIYSIYKVTGIDQIPYHLPADTVQPWFMLWSS